MPQMSPLPWMLILLITLMCFYLILMNIYFYFPMKNMNLMKKKYFNFKIKW
uniref:ATP synthase F0 subunit 8 n=1 Tax=Mycopsylla gardenensis TaxID=2008466 RepID=A0A343SSK6_9HEMI|nr:ATP synthase F0 subunit 8 [Mycopsylla gardenensis]